MDFIPDALSLSLRLLDERQRQRALEEARAEAQEREWPSVVLEDLLDADEVKPRARYPHSPIIGLTNII